MTQTVMHPGALSRGEDADFTPNGGRVPRLSGDIRHLIPKLGLREYWYPLIGAGRVPKKKALRVRMLGEDLCVFKGRGEVYALTDICPHRGARLSEGDCHYDGTISCPYHGWVFDGEGRNVAVLSEGPNSIVCGKPGTEARAYPTKVLKGIVFVWMGDGEPAPIEEDVPEEFFRSDVRVFFNDHIRWRANWEVALENSMDAHVQYVHRDNLEGLLNANGVRVPGGSGGMRPRFTGNGFTFDLRELLGMMTPATHKQDTFPSGWKWPKHLYRRYWAWLTGPFFFALRARIPTMTNPDNWVVGHHLPGMFRAAGSTEAEPKHQWSILARMLTHRDGAGLFGLYTRQVVPIDDRETRMWYHHSVVVTSPLQAAWAWFVYFTWGRWYAEYNLSQQDMSVMTHQVYDTPEKLSSTDAEVVQWRKLVVTKHFGGRNHPFTPEQLQVENPDEPVTIPAPAVDPPVAVEAEAPAATVVAEAEAVVKAATKAATRAAPKTKAPRATNRGAATPKSDAPKAKRATPKAKGDTPKANGATPEAPKSNRRKAKGSE